MELYSIANALPLHYTCRKTFNSTRRQFQHHR